MLTFDLSLYLVTDSELAASHSLEQIVCEAVKGGVTIVQLREKELATGEFIARARRLKEALAPYGVPLIINDRADVALASGADGLHIGQSDMSYADARALMGPDKIIGLSVESMEQVELANSIDVDYIGISPLHSTPTKTDTAQPFGVEGCAAAVSLTRHPSVAIGGINMRNVAETMATGVDGVAVVSAIICAADPCLAATEMLEAINASRPSWSSVALAAVQGTYQRIITHPFNVGLMQGTLNRDHFRRYIEQDTIYIRNYAEEMEIVAEMLPEGKHKRLFTQFAHEGMEAEKSLHAMLAQMLGGIGDVEPSPTTLAYMAHTRQWVDARDLELSMAAILPCIWIYSLVGRHIFENCCLEENPYRAWVETYASEMIFEGVNLSIALVDALADNASQSRRTQMRQEFIKATQFELDFWHAATLTHNS